jgi:hypothetical protein
VWAWGCWNWEQDCRYLPYLFVPVKESIVFANGKPIIVTIKNSYGDSYVFAFKRSLVFTNVFAVQKSVKESIVFANGKLIIVTVQNSYGISYVFAYKDSLKGPKLLTSF